MYQMTNLKPGVIIAIILAVIFIGVTGVRATITGEASVTVRPGNSSQSYTESVLIPWLATQYQTPAVSLGVSPVFGDTELATARVGVDIPFGVLAASTDAQGRAENDTVRATPNAIGQLKFIDEADTVAELAAFQAGISEPLSSDIVLYSPSLGGQFPGIEHLDPANAASHMLPIPEPGSLLLIRVGFVGFLRRRKCIEA